MAGVWYEEEEEEEVADKKGGNPNATFSGVASRTFAGLVRVRC